MDLGSSLGLGTARTLIRESFGSFGLEEPAAPEPAPEVHEAARPTGRLDGLFDDEWEPDDGSGGPSVPPPAAAGPIGDPDEALAQPGDEAADGSLDEQLQRLADLVQEPAAPVPPAPARPWAREPAPALDPAPRVTRPEPTPRESSREPAGRPDATPARSGTRLAAPLPGADRRSPTGTGRHRQAGLAPAGRRPRGGESGGALACSCSQFKLDGKQVTVKHRVTNIYRRETGVWKIVHHHTDVSQAMVDVLSRLKTPPGQVRR